MAATLAWGTSVETATGGQGGHHQVCVPSWKKPLTPTSHVVQAWHHRSKLLGLWEEKRGGIDPESALAQFG